MSSIEFSRTYSQAKWIAGLYKVVGLYSIPLLTVVTIVSMTNVFTAGTFARFPYVATIWAFIFAFAIDVNIVRLFVESKLDNSRGAFWLGLGLCIVTGAALFLEGLQQSIGFLWSNQYIQIAIGILVAGRVILVIVLMAREGVKLGSLLLENLQVNNEQKQEETQVIEPVQARNTGPIVNPHVVENAFTEEVLTSEPEVSEQETQIDIPIVNPPETSKRTMSKQSVNARSRVQKVLKVNPHATIPDIVNKAKVSKGYASRIRSEYMSEQKIAS